LGSDQGNTAVEFDHLVSHNRKAPTEKAQLVLDSQHRGPVVNSIVISNLSSRYAPNGQSLISSTTISHASESEVRRHLAIMWGVSTGEWRFLAKYEIHSALPLFAPGAEQLKSLHVNENRLPRR
jgi:hypothetical protein